MACAGILIIGGWVDAKKAVNLIEWDLLLLIGSMLGISRVCIHACMRTYMGISKL
jgi:hypothetical protein